MTTLCTQSRIDLFSRLKTLFDFKSSDTELGTAPGMVRAIATPGGILNMREVTLGPNLEADVMFVSWQFEDTAWISTVQPKVEHRMASDKELEAVVNHFEMVVEACRNKYAH